MFSNNKSRLLLFSTFLFLLLPAFAQDPNAILNEMFKSVKAIKGITFTIDSKERIAGKLHEEVISFKINISPFKEYIYQIQPKTGLQILYVTGANDGKAKINPAAFPWVILNLHPEGDLMLENHHHSIFDAGYIYTTSILEFLLQKYAAQKSNVVVLNGIVRMEGLECYHLTFTNPNYRLTLYTSIAGDTPMKIAKKLHIDNYSIIENNAGLKPNTNIKPGTKLILPNDYASKMELYISKTNMIPVYLKIFDSKGLFEEFTFKNIVVNPVFTDIDFSDKNPNYKF